MSRKKFLSVVHVLALLLLVACQAKAPQALLETGGDPYAENEGKTVDQFVGAGVPGELPTMEEASSSAPTAMAPQPARYVPALPNQPNRLIIKNADLQLEVANTDIAMDGVTQVVADAGGYIISSRVWYQHAGEEDLKYATLTLGIPVDQFEFALKRLRGLAEKVLDETAAGQDVSDEYVDLQSRLENLQATRDRIRQFLERAQTVEEALRVNEQLAQVEGEIEQVQGRMNYLFDRAAYSTITVTLAPVRPEIPPAPTPRPWAPEITFLRASATLGFILRGLTNIAIWLGVVVLPLLLPPLAIVWGVARFSRKRNAQLRTTNS